MTCVGMGDAVARGVLLRFRSDRVSRSGISAATLDFIAWVAAFFWARCRSVRTRIVV